MGCEHDISGHRHQLHSAEVIERAALMASALGDPGRLRLLELLADGQHCVSELAEETGDSMSSISQRLKILHTAGLLSRERDGKHIYYSLADSHVEQIMKQLFEHASE